MTKRKTAQPRGTKTTDFNREVSKQQERDTFGIDRIALSEGQKECQSVIRDNVITFVEGPAGAGKSMSILHYCVKEYLKNPNLNIIIVKTPVEVGKDRIGFLPAGITDKLAVHFEATKATLSALLNKGKVECDLDKRIKFLAPNFILGATIDNAMYVIEEAQQMEPMILKLLLERIGEGTKCIITGDSTQLYTEDHRRGDRQGMSHAIGKFFDEDSEGNLTSKYDGIGFFAFNVDDVMRSDIVKVVIRAYSS